MNLLTEYAMQFVGVRYKYGGASPMDGLDCSGLVQIILKAAGEDPIGDQTAQSLYIHFLSRGQLNVREAGSLAFYGKAPSHISHVAFCVDAHRMIEAGSGDSKTLTVQDAIDRQAFVRMNLIDARRDLVCCIKPLYKGIS